MISFFFFTSGFAGDNETDLTSGEVVARSNSSVFGLSKFSIKSKTIFLMKISDYYY